MNRKSTIRAVGRRTRLKNRDVQLLLETLIAVWTEELARGGRIEIENFAVIEVRPPRRLRCRMSKSLRRNLQHHHET